jgi:hypothetical protein
MSLLSLVLGVALAALAAAGCGGGHETATPSPAATASWTGPLFVYTRSIEQPDATGHGRSVYEAVVYDVGARREFASFQPSDPNRHFELAIAGDKIVANLGSGVVRRDADGSNPMVLRQASSGGEIIEMSASRDGQRLAITESRPEEGPTPTPGAVVGQQEPRRQVTSVVVIDIATGEEIAAITQSPPGFEGFVGQAGKITWRDDGQGVVVQGYTYSERPGGTATVMLDGSVRTHALTDYVSVAPNGRYAEYGSLSSIPVGGLSALQREIVLYDFAAQRQVASVGDDDLLFTPWEWSPDGTEFLYSTYSPRPSSDYPGFFESDPASERLYLLRIDGSPPELVSDIESVHERWYGDRHVKFFCLGKPVHGPWCSGERGRSEPVEIYVGDIFVGSGEGVEIIGFIDR